MKKLIYGLLIGLSLVSCRPTIRGVVTEVDSYGSVHTSFTIEEALSRGFDYADVVKVNFSESGEFIMPITTAYSEVGIGLPSYCHYSKVGEASFGFCQGDFHRMCGGNAGEKVKVTMYEKQGYAKEYELIQSVYYNDRSMYPTDEAFANFREITTGNIKPKTVYRSGNPLNFKANPVRCGYVDSLARHYGIKSEVDIADTHSDVEVYADSEGFVSTYCYNLFLNGNTATLGMGSDTFCERAYEGFAEGMRHILKTQPPYLIHCNEGKDRCGFYCMLLESLTGASVEELQYDYMTTFCNLYKMEEGTERYNFNLKINGDRLIWLIANPDDINKKGFDWNTINVNSVNPKEAAEAFLLIKCRMTAEEVAALEKKLTK